MSFSNTSSFAQRRAGRVLPDRAQHGCCARAYRDISTACLGIAAPLGAPEQCSNFAFKLIQKKSARRLGELIDFGALIVGRGLGLAIYLRDTPYAPPWGLSCSIPAAYGPGGSSPNPSGTLGASNLGGTIMWRPWRVAAPWQFTNFAFKLTQENRQGGWVSDTT